MVHSGNMLQLRYNTATYNPNSYYLFLTHFVPFILDYYSGQYNNADTDMANGLEDTYELYILKAAHERDPGFVE
jgi:hypothetical protein